jgi:diacylglycerol O-acyltransferase
MHQRLGGEDASWLHMEDATNPMVINALVELGGRLEVPRVQALVRRMFPDRFRSRVRESRIGAPVLELDSSFDVGEHVEHVDLLEGDAALAAFVGERVSSLLDPTRPLFRVYVIDRPGSPTALLFRVHHALADGFALLSLLFAGCDPHGTPEPRQETHGTTRRSLLSYGASLARLLTLPPDPRTRLKRPLGFQKRVAWSAPILLDEIKAIGRPVSATANDVLVSAVAGALGRYLWRGGDNILGLHAMMPVNLRPKEAPTTLGNDFGLVVLALPVGIADPRERLLMVKRRMDQLKASPEALVAVGLLRAMGQAPRVVEDLGVAFFGMKASLVLTNVPGPRAKLHLDGVEIERLMFWVPQAAKMGLGVSIFSYAGKVTLGVIADTEVMADPTELVEDIVADLSGQPGSCSSSESRPPPRPPGADPAASP